MIPCPQPATVRCLGWSGSLNAMQCGDGYLPHSVTCTTCAPGYFPSLQLCVACPPTKSEAIVNGIAVVVVVLVILLVALSMVIVAIRRTKGSTKVALIMLKDYVEWTMVAWQTIVQVGKRTTGGPDVLRRLYMFIAVVELDSAVIAAPEVSVRQLAASGSPISTLG